MTKNELAEQVASRNGLAASQARQVVETIIDVVSDELAAGGEVALAGFGRDATRRQGQRFRSRPARRRSSPRRAH
jgi:nucleoid DNA-binding protein